MEKMREIQKIKVKEFKDLEGEKQEIEEKLNEIQKEKEKTEKKLNEFQEKYNEKQISNNMLHSILL